MQNGMTYMVRPTMAPSNSGVMIRFICSGSIQLFVGPALRSSLEQMKVWSSTRATSSGSVRARIELGLSFSFSRMIVPLASNSRTRRAHSASDPSQ